MKKKYNSPSSIIFEMTINNNILATSEIPMGGGTDHFDTPKYEGVDNWDDMTTDDSDHYWK